MKTLLKGALVASTVLFFTACSKDDEGDPIAESIVPLEFTCDEIGNLMETNYTFIDRGPGIDYIIPCTVKIFGDVKIDPGVTIAFKNEGGFNVRGEGSLNAVGSAVSPILITSTELTKGDWKGILFDSDDNKNRLEYVTISNAGGGAFNSNGDLGAIITWSNAQVSIANCTITDSEDVGINMYYHDGNISISNTTITRCTYPIQGYSEYISNILGGNFRGNAIDAIRIIGSGSNAQGTWKKLSVPYRIDGKISVNNVKLTIEPGVIIEMENGAWFDIGDEDTSTFKAVGTSTEPILFTGVTKQAGAWKGFRFEHTNSVENEISYATIEYAGSGTELYSAAIFIRGAANLKLNTVLFKDITGCGVMDTYDPNPNFSSSNLEFQNTGGTLCHT